MLGIFQFQAIFQLLIKIKLLQLIYKMKDFIYLQEIDTNTMILLKQNAATITLKRLKDK